MSSKYPFDYKEVQGLSIVEIFNILDDWINCHSWVDIAGFSEELNRTHRTLQQAMIHMFWKILLQYGRDHAVSFSYDGRNEDAVMLCRKLVELKEKGEVTEYLPYV